MFIRNSHISSIISLLVVAISHLIFTPHVHGASVQDTHDTISRALYAALLNDTSTLQELRYGEYGPASPEFQDIILLEFATSVSLFGEETLLSEADIALSYEPDHETKIFIKYTRSLHEMQQIRNLKNQIYYQTWASFFNLISSSASQLLNGQTAILGELGLNSVYRFGRPHPPTARQKKLHYLSATIERKGWYLPEETAAKLHHDIEHISRHIEEDRDRKNLRKARFYMEQGAFDTADFYLEHADKTNTNNDTLPKYQQILERALGEQERRRITDGAVSDTWLHTMSHDSKECLEILLASFLAGDDETFTQSKVPYIMCTGSDGLAILDFIEAAQHSARGLLSVCVDSLNELAREYDNSFHGNLAEGLLQTEYLNPYRHYEEKKKSCTRDIWRYIMTGERTLDEQAYIASSIAMHYARNFASNLGVFFAFDVCIRGIRTAVNNPVDTTDLKYAAQRYLALSETHDPFSPERSAVAESLADIYKRDHEYGLAERYYDKAGLLTPRFKKNLREKSANDLYRMALIHESIDVKKSLLQGILEHYADTSSASRANKELARIVEREKILFSIPYDILKEHPFIAEECGLPPGLLDGEESNGEMSEKGLIVHTDGAIEFEDSTTGIVLSDTVGKETTQHMADWWNDYSIQSGYMQHADDALRRRKFPVEIVGSAGSGGFDLYPRLLPLPADASLDLFK